MMLKLWDSYANGGAGFFPRKVNVLLRKYTFQQFNLVCNRCLNTSLCCFTTTSGLEYGSESGLKYYQIRLKFWLFSITYHLI